MTLSNAQQPLVGLVGWRGMVGSVLMDRMQAEGDFGLIEPMFFSTSNAGGKAPAQAKNEATLKDAFDIEALKKCDVVITCQGGDYTTEVFPKLRAAGWNGHWIDAASSLRMTDDAVIVLVIGDVETDRGRRIHGGVGLAERAWEQAAAPEGYRLAGVALDDVAAVRKMTKLWGDEAGRATKTDRILVLGADEAGRRRALAGASLDIDWTWPPKSLRGL